MANRMRALMALVYVALVAGGVHAADGPNSMDSATEARLKAALADPQRDQANAARDPHRHPLETLKFFGLRQDMTVLEVYPGGGWWTEFLAPVLAPKGRYLAAHFDPSAQSEYAQRGLAAFKDKLAKDPDRYGKVHLTALVTAPGAADLVPPNSVDLVLTFRNLHSWMGQNQAKPMLDAMFRALKPGGYLGIKEHRASTAMPQDPKALLGYVREDYATQLIESAGFKLVAKSEVNANPKDTKDYPKGVWTLPPSFREGDVDRAKYAAIGESDRFTLLFQKPK